MSKRTVVFGVLIAAVIVIAAASQTWVQLTLDPSVTPQANMAVSGVDANKAITPIVIALLVGGIVLSIAGKVFRIVLGVLIALLSASAGWAAISVLRFPVAAASGQLTEISGITGGAEQDIVVTHATTVWPWVSVVGAVLGVIFGVFVVFFGHRWKVAGQKYSRDRVATKQTSDDAEPDRISDWDRLSDGEDPTDDEPGLSSSPSS